MGAADGEVVLYGHWICPYSVRVEFDLVRLGRPYRMVEVPPSGVRPEGFVLPVEFVEHSERLEIPMIEDAEGFLADSLPILDRLDPTASPGARATARWVDAVVFPPMVGVYYARTEDAAAEAARRLAEVLVALAERVEASGWLCAAGPSMAESTIIPLYVRLEGLRALGFSAPLPAPVERHAEACLALPAGHAVAWTSVQTDEFVQRLSSRRRG